MTPQPVPLELPGFTTPGSPKADSRIFSMTAGGLEFVLMENVPLDQPEEDLAVYVDYEAGNEIKNWCTIQNPCILRRVERNGTRTIFVKTLPDTLVIYPGTYFLRGVKVVSGEQFFYKTLTVLNNPQLSQEMNNAVIGRPMDSAGGSCGCACACPDLSVGIGIVPG
jgi:hypothetical protein